MKEHKTERDRTCRTTEKTEQKNTYQASQWIQTQILKKIQIKAKVLFMHCFLCS